jgi:hypothetical protein
MQTPGPLRYLTMCWSSLVVHGAHTACSSLTMHVFTCAHCRFGALMGTNGEKEDEDSPGVAAKKPPRGATRQHKHRSTRWINPRTGTTIRPIGIGALFASSLLLVADIVAVSLSLAEKFNSSVKSVITHTSTS